jgi:hypothetical protein
MHCAPATLMTFIEPAENFDAIALPPPTALMV